MSAAPPSNRTPPLPPAPPAPSDPGSGNEAVAQQSQQAAEGWLRTLGTTSLVIGIVAAVLTVVSPYRDPITTAVLAALAVVAVVLGLVVRTSARRSGRRSTTAFAGFLLGVVALALLAISFAQWAFILVLSERPGFEEQPAPPAVVRQVDDELRELEASARTAVQTLDAIRDADGTYPTELAVTTRGDRLITPEGVVVAGLPDGAMVDYETTADGTRYELVLFGTYGGTVFADSDRGLVSSSAGTGG